MSTLHQPLAKNLRTQLENTVKAARDVAEIAARAALTNLGVGDRDAHTHLSDEQKALRRRLRAHGRQIGDIKQVDDSQEIRHLVWEVAYEQWHRMLFARFLAENNLLMWELGAPVTLAECDELAQDVSTSLGAKSGWELAGILAARMLPQIFKPQSPALAVAFALEHQKELEKLLSNLSKGVFTASDSLGWVYQFWQSKRKDEVNASEVKIGADELPAVTQLFTEPYMVEFLLHNSLGAWWYTRHPGKPCPVELTYLRTLDDGTPAAGRFEGWPATLAEFKLLDPCCGSGHFLVAAFLLLVPMRMASETLSAMAAVDLVLQDNLHGLEIDPRCVEIAVFALALAAWRFPDEEGHPIGVRPDMPPPNIACCGLKVVAKPQDWEALVPEGLAYASELRQELRLLHSSFSQAPLLGSLLDPSASFRDDLATSSFYTLQSLLEQALLSEQSMAGEVQDVNEDTWELALSAQSSIKAVHLLKGSYNLVITNVPYLGRGQQSDELKDYCSRYYPDAKNDLANVFLERCLQLSCNDGAGVVQIVMPQNWLFLTGYRKQRESLLKQVKWNLLARLGEGGFESNQAAGAFIILLTMTRAAATDDFLLHGIDASAPRTGQEKAKSLLCSDLLELDQLSQLKNPDARVVLERQVGGVHLAEYADSLVGIQTGDYPRFAFSFWELLTVDGVRWEYYERPGINGVDRTEAVLWEEGDGQLLKLVQEKLGENGTGAWLRGAECWGKKGVSVQLMRDLTASLYSGAKYDQMIAVIRPKNNEHLLAIWCFCSSLEFNKAVRRIDHAIKVTNSTLVKVPFDIEHWQAVAAERYPDGVPKLSSNDPTQWIFHGHPQSSIDPLQVAVARLLGYTWPGEVDKALELSGAARDWISRCSALHSHVDDDGIVCLSPVRGEKAAHERLLALLIDSWETVDPGSWKASVLDKLLANADCAGKGLDVWLREKFFEQHAKRFQHRPFIWHVWDGLKDGFGALINYHLLDAKNLERLIHTYLGDWIRIQEAGAASGLDGAQIRLAAARQLKTKLEAILEGDAPLDVFVRWKPLDQQSVGWNPDLNDGVRMNIRPFMMAEVLRHNKKPKLNISWDKDRGKDVVSAPWFHKFDGERINDHHLTLAEKIAETGNET